MMQASLEMVLEQDAGAKMNPAVEEPAFEPCSSPDCAGTGAFSLNGHRACRQVCVEDLLRAAILEEGMRAATAALRARPRTLLGRILIEQGTITEAQLEAALRSQRATGAGRLGCWLKQMVELPEADFTAALSIQWSCPVFRAGTFSPASMAPYLPKALVEQTGAVPLRLNEDGAQRLSLCFEDHLDYELIHAAGRMHGIPVDAGLLTATEFWTATDDLCRAAFPPALSLQAPSLDCMAQAMSYALIAAGAQHARLALLKGCYWLRFWTGPGAMSTESLDPRDAYDILCTPLPGSSDAPDPGAAAATLGTSMLGVLEVRPGAVLPGSVLLTR